MARHVFVFLLVAVCLVQVVVPLPRERRSGEDWSVQFEPENKVSELTQEQLEAVREALQKLWEIANRELQREPGTDAATEGDAAVSHTL